MAAVEAVRSDWTQQTQLKLGDVRYDVRVTEPVEGQFRAEWFCNSCNEQGALSPIGSEAKVACTEAKIAICVHHSMLHRRSAAGQLY